MPKELSFKILKDEHILLDIFGHVIFCGSKEDCDKILDLVNPFWNRVQKEWNENKETPMMMVQVKLRRKIDKATFEEQICWLPSNDDVKVGNRCTLKDENKDVWWDIAEVYSGNKVDKSHIPDDWNVGGLEKGCCR